MQQHDGDLGNWTKFSAMSGLGRQTSRARCYTVKDVCSRNSMPVDNHAETSPGNDIIHCCLHVWKPGSGYSTKKGMRFPFIRITFFPQMKDATTATAARHQSCDDLLS